MTTASSDARAGRRPSPATANGTSMKPPCAIDEYASMRTMFVCRSATRLPTVIDARREHPEQRFASTSCAAEEAEEDELSSATKPPAFDATERNAVTGRRRALVGVGRPEVERHRRDLEREADER